MAWDPSLPFSSPDKMTALKDEQVDNILFAARAGDIEALKESLSEIQDGGDPAFHLALQCTNESGNSLLHFAFANGHEGRLRGPDTRPDPLCSTAL